MSYKNIKKTKKIFQRLKLFLKLVKDLSQYVKYLLFLQMLSQKV